MLRSMDSSSIQHQHQEMGLQTLESMLACTKSPLQEKKPRPADMQSQKCPRCDSANTKFCYYNNYSLSQPRYFCKSCRRYWTKGGTLRNVPVGGGCRKNKRSSSSSSSSATSSSSSKRTQDHPIPSIAYDSNDLSLAIARLQKQNSGPLGLDDRDFSIWAQQQHQSMAHHQNHHGGGDHVLGSFCGNASSFDAMRSGFLENLSGGNGNGIHNLYYEMGSGNENAEVENGMSSGANEMGRPYEDFGGGGVGTTASSTAVTTTVKQEMCGGVSRDGDGRILWGFPWQSMAGDGNVLDFDSARLNWNGIASSNWQGLLNSPLM